MIGALLIGTALAVAVLAYVVAPLVLGVRPRVASRSTGQAPDTSIAALREIEFDKATGKLSDVDYAALREQYAGKALAAMRVAETQGSGAVDPVEAAVQAYRATHVVCPTCGVRPEDDARYCSTCGGFLPAACDACGVAVTEKGIRFCIVCGHRLAV